MFLTVYHSQTDNSSEITNQIAEVVLYHWFIMLKTSVKWFTVLLHLQTVLNNFIKYNFMNFNSTQILFEFHMHKILNLLKVNESDTVIINVINSACSSKQIKLVVMNQYWLIYINAKNVIAFTAMHIKHYYDQVHTSRFFQTDNIINLQLHCEYILSDLQNKKLD